MTKISKHSDMAAHYRTLAGKAMDAATKTQFPDMKTDYLKIAAAWHDLAAETDFIKH